MKKFVHLLIVCLTLITPALATVDDAISAAMEAADPYVKQGFTVREDQWGGDLGVGEKKAFQHTLFKGNDYWFFMATDTLKAKVNVHIYNGEGKLADQEGWQKGSYAGIRFRPPSTGSYYLIVEVEKSPEERTHWALVYAYK
ncbi:MAG: hypothetical protein ABIT76_06410 [Chthoniobacterales bacterium]